MGNSPLSFHSFSALLIWFCEEQITWCMQFPLGQPLKNSCPPDSVAFISPYSIVTLQLVTLLRAVLLSKSTVKASPSTFLAFEVELDSVAIISSYSIGIVFIVAGLVSIIFFLLNYKLQPVLLINNTLLYSCSYQPHCLLLSSIYTNIISKQFHRIVTNNMSSAMHQSKKSSALKPLFESYLPRTQSALRNSSSVAQFMARSKGNNLSFQFGKTPSRASNGLDLSFCHIVSPSKDFQQSRKKMRGSKSCGKGCGLVINESEKLNLSSANHTRLESIYAPERRNLYKEIMSSSKKMRVTKPKTDAGSTLSRISEELRRIKNPEINLTTYNTTLPYQNKSASNRKTLNSTTTQMQKSVKLDRRVTSSVKRKKSRDTTVAHNRTEVEPNLDLDSAAIITDTTTAKRMDDYNGKQEYAKLIAASLANNLKALEKNKEKCGELEMNSKKFTIINETLNGVIHADQVWGDVLKQVQTKLQELHAENENKHKAEVEGMKMELEKARAELSKEKAQVEILNAEKNKLARENQEKSMALEKQKVGITDLRKQANEAQDIKKQAQLKIRELSEDLTALYKENKKLAKVVKTIYTELQKSKKRERVLVKLLKNGNSESESAEVSEHKQEEKKKDLERKVVEVGKKKVKIPVLDFSRLAPKKPTKLKVVKYYGGDDLSSEYASEESNMENEDEGSLFVQSDFRQKKAQRVKTSLMRNPCSHKTMRQMVHWTTFQGKQAPYHKPFLHQLKLTEHENVVNIDSIYTLFFFPFIEYKYINVQMQPIKPLMSEGQLKPLNGDPQWDLSAAPHPARSSVEPCLGQCIPRGTCWS
eukprot:TRINITY_DN2738_c0_g1_i1.p1 TRINITY_DN2738_c0_g1~~TRINITY_DN2738_c0_g1_i1.p1  ORF type:complete len:817 (+),score=54.78 TRINITY_DN2738_c0_g1_i1:2015-4465(+)